MPYDSDHLNILSDFGFNYISSGVGVARSNAPLTNSLIELENGLTHIPVSTRVFFSGIIKYPIGYGIMSRLLPEQLYFMTLRYWEKRFPLFHYYFHPFEIAGCSRMGKKWLPQEARNLPTFLYYLRCNNRRSFFKKLFDKCRFDTIESYYLLKFRTP